jgi:hypothetical protein
VYLCAAQAVEEMGEESGFCQEHLRPVHTLPQNKLPCDHVDASLAHGVERVVQATGLDGIVQPRAAVLFHQYHLARLNKVSRSQPVHVDPRAEFGGIKCRMIDAGRHVAVDKPCNGLSKDVKHFKDNVTC